MVNDNSVRNSKRSLTTYFFVYIVFKIYITLKIRKRCILGFIINIFIFYCNKHSCEYRKLNKRKNKLLKTVYRQSTIDRAHSFSWKFYLRMKKVKDFSWENESTWKFYMGTKKVGDFSWKTVSTWKFFFSEFVYL